MASTRRVVWQAGMQIWLLARQYMVEAGYDNASTFREAIIAANSQIIDPAAIPVGTIITIPYLDN